MVYTVEFARETTTYLFRTMEEAKAFCQTRTDKKGWIWMTPVQDEKALETYDFYKA